MTDVAVDHAWTQLGDAVDNAWVKHEPDFSTHGCRRVVAAIDADDLVRFVEDADELADLRAAQKARAEMAAGEPAIPWEQVKAGLGLV